YFFFLRNYLRWYFMIVLAIKVFLYGFFAAISFEEDAIGVQVGENILAISMLFPLIVWLPYVAVKLIQNVNKKERNSCLLFTFNHLDYFHSFKRSINGNSSIKSSMI